MMATRYSQLDTIRILLLYGADVNAQDNVSNYFMTPTSNNFFVSLLFVVGIQPFDNFSKIWRRTSHRIACGSGCEPKSSKLCR